MKSLAKKLFVLLAILSMTLGACNMPNGNSTNDGTPATPAGTGEVGVTVVSVPDPTEVAKAYLDAWAGLDYVAMYNLLATPSKDSIRIEDFDTRYGNVTQEAVIESIEYEILQTFTNPKSAQVLYRVTLNSSLVGPITRDTQMSLSLESGQWRVVWDDTLILPELAGGNELSMEAIWPTRGIIYDRTGEFALASDTEAVAVGVIPSNIGEKGGNALLQRMEDLTGIDSRYWAPIIFADDAPYIVPVGEIPVNIFETWEPYLAPHYDVLTYSYYFTRLAYLRNAGAHVIGWVGAVPLEEADAWVERGYPIDAKVGRMGIEAWGEEYLSGKPSAKLYVRTPAKEEVTVIASREAEPSSSIYTTLDVNLQLWAQLALRDFTGAVVVLERDTGRVLAMASSPTFNPNGADANDAISVWSTYFDGTYDDPFLNRATQGQYPPGSIFKVITLSAALETDIFNPYLTFDCQHYWYGPDGYEFKDWTVDKDKPPSGVLNMMEGLMRSCNPWFYQMGFTLYENGYTTAVADMAREFGLGSVTGIEVVPEEPGNITNPEDNPSAEPWFNAVQQAIGQSDTVITPIQAAAYIAAIGNGGTLYRPQLIERIENPAGEVLFEFEPIVNNTLPISDNTLLAVQQGLKLVTNNARGTAYYTFSVGYLDASNIIGKTGTAQNPGVDPHAWFIGYTTFGNPYRPDIAIAVLVENIGDGSEFAAPIFRRLVETYFFGSPQIKYPWESSIYVFNPDYFLPEEETEGGE